MERTNDPNTQAKCHVDGCDALTTQRVKKEQTEIAGCHHHTDAELEAALQAAGGSPEEPDGSD